MSPCHNLEPSLVARDSSRLLSVKPNEWMHLSPFYTRMHGEWLRYAKSTSQFHWRFLLVRDVRGFQVNPLCRHDITSPFPPSGNGGYVCNLDVFLARWMLGSWSVITLFASTKTDLLKSKRGRRRESPLRKSRPPWSGSEQPAEDSSSSKPSSNGYAHKSNRNLSRKTDLL